MVLLDCSTALNSSYATTSKPASPHSATNKPLPAFACFPKPSTRSRLMELFWCSAITSTNAAPSTNFYKNKTTASCPLISKSTCLKLSTAVLSGTNASPPAPPTNSANCSKFPTKPNGSPNSNKLLLPPMVLSLIDLIPCQPIENCHPMPAASSTATQILPKRAGETPPLSFPCSIRLL